MITPSTLTSERLRAQFTYSPDSGVFTRRSTGKACLTNADGYIAIKVDGRVYLAHRLAFLYMTGAWPVNMADHKDGNRANNRWANLRDVSNRVNQQNRRGPGLRNTTGFLGVTRRSFGKPFIARIRIDSKMTHLGGFDTAEEAAAAYLSAKRRHHAGCTV